MPSDKKYISEDLEYEYQKEADEAINQIIDSAYSRETRGRKKTGPRKDKGAYHKITISMTLQEKEQIEIFAQNNDVSVSKMIREILRDAGVLKK